MQREDLTGQRFGEWEALKYAGNRSWLCRCSCGVERVVRTSTLKMGRSTNCGNKVKHPIEGIKKAEDYSGKRIGSLEVIRYIGDAKWECKCDCGNIEVQSTRYLKRSKNPRCKMCRNEYDNITGQTFGDWSVGEYIGESRFKCTCRVCGIERVISSTELKNGERIRCRHTLDKRSIEKRTAGDYEILEYYDGYAKVRCKCGMEKEISDSNIWYCRKIGYKCNHTVGMKKRFGKLTVDRYVGDGNWECTCACGNKKIVDYRNLIGGHTISCGCIKHPKYSKEEVEKFLEEFINKNGDKPFIYDIMEHLDIGMTAAYNYLDNYGLRSKLNSKFGSRIEREVYNIVYEYDKEVVLHSRKVIPPKEIDIYLPNARLAIEINGNYWHSYYNKGKTYHQEKTMECAKKGVRLIHIFEYEWRDNITREAIEQMIKGLLGGRDTIYARDLQVVEIESSRAREFLIENHMQGYATANINIALVSGENIYGLMTFGVPRFNNNYQYENVRLCFDRHVNVVGGTERMFKYFTSKYDPQSIITYVNISKFTGNIYPKIGFKLSEKKAITEPNYVWVNLITDEVLTRYQAQKHRLLSSGYGKPEQTEEEIMTEMGFVKIHDCGNIKLEYRRDN